MRTQQPGRTVVSAPASPRPVLPQQLAAPGAVACASCGAAAPSSYPLTWSLAISAGQRSWSCERCARSQLAGIETRTDEATGGA